MGGRDWLGLNFVNHNWRGKREMGQGKYVTNVKV